MSSRMRMRLCAPDPSCHQVSPESIRARPADAQTINAKPNEFQPVRNETLLITGTLRFFYFVRRRSLNASAFFMAFIVFVSIEFHFMFTNNGHLNAVLPAWVRLTAFRGCDFLVCVQYPHPLHGLVRSKKSPCSSAMFRKIHMRSSYSNCGPYGCPAKNA